MTLPSTSSDGYIRLSLDALSELAFTHLSSGVDDDILDDLRLQTVPAQQAGFSEWASNTAPPISLGWSWFIHNKSKRLLPAPEAIRSNVMLIDAHGYDLGKTATAYLFATWLALHEWQHTVSSSINLAPPAHC